jgi:membrane fusion protein (multidrug efflux system)
LHDSSGFQVIGYVPAKDSAKVAVHQRVRVQFDAFPNREFLGEVAAISPAVAKNSGALSIWMELNDSQGLGFRNRMLGRASVTIGTGTSSLAIPRSAIVREGLIAFVFVRSVNGNIERRQVTTGPEDDQYVSILTGLQLGEEVAVTQVMGLQTAHASIR